MRTVHNHSALKGRKRLYPLLMILGSFLLCIFLLWLSKSFFKPMILTQQDIYGTYVIDREIFPGKQANWQYANFRFEITTDNRMIFETRRNKEKWNVETIDVSFSTGYWDLDIEQYCNKRIRIHSDSTNHHVVQDNPTLYRKNFNRFYYVFESEKFGNMFFKKGQWNDKQDFNLSY